LLTIVVYSHSQQHQGDNGVMLAEARALAAPQPWGRCPMSKENDETLVERVEHYLQEVSARLHKFIFDDDEDSPINFNIHEVDCRAIVEFVLAEYIQVQDGATAGTSAAASSYSRQPPRRRRD
jgi:hypothetical protein